MIQDKKLAELAYQLANTILTAPSKADRLASQAHKIMVYLRIPPHFQPIKGANQ